LQLLDGAILSVDTNDAAKVFFTLHLAVDEPAVLFVAE
jgi:hypothetical protein